MRNRMLLLLVVLTTFFSTTTNSEELHYRATDFYGYVDSTLLGPVQEIYISIEHEYFEEENKEKITKLTVVAGDETFTEADISLGGEYTYVEDPVVPPSIFTIIDKSKDPEYEGRFNSLGISFVIDSQELEFVGYFHKGLPQGDTAISQSYEQLFPGPKFSLTLNDENTIVPEEGGRVYYDADLTEFEPDIYLEQWSVVVMSDGDYYPIHKKRELEATDLDGNLYLDNNYINVPDWFEAGEHTLIWYVQDELGQRTEASMTFTKEGVEVQD